MNALTRMCNILYAGALLVLSAGSAQATVLFSQALTTIGGPFSRTPSQMVADTFSIAGGGAINEVTWYGDRFTGGALGTFVVSFYADSGSGPEALLAYSAVTPTIVDTGQIDSYSKHILEFTTGIPTSNASAGVGYFFAITNLGPVNFTWAQSNIGTGEWISFNGGASWADEAADRNGSTAYTLSSTSAVPEPASLALLALVSQDSDSAGAR